MSRREQLRSKVKGIFKRSKYLPQGVAAALSILIISIIVFAPTAAALTVEIHGLSNNQEVGHGGNIKFVAQIKINSGELIPLQQLNIVLDGSTYVFNPSTGAASAPTSLAISSVEPLNFPVGQIFTPPYGYTYGYFLGYGYASGYSYGSPYSYGYGVEGPRTITYRVTLDPSQLSLGSHTVKLDVVTALSPTSTYSSSTVTFTVVAGASQGNQVSGGSPSVDNSAVTSVKVVLAGATYTDASVPGIITTIKFTSPPSTPVTVAGVTGKSAAKYVDVKASNFASGTATITLTYTDAEIAAAGLDESTLTLYYFSIGGTWVQLSSVVRDTVGNTVSGTIDVTLLTGTYISLAGSTISAAPPLIITPGDGIVPARTTSSTSTSTSTSSTTTTSTTAPTTSTSTVTKTNTKTTTSTSTTTSTKQTTSTTTSTVTDKKTSTATETKTSTSIKTEVKGETKIITSTSTSTSTETSRTTQTEIEKTTITPPGVTVTETKRVDAASELTYAIIAIAVIAVVAAAVLTVRRPRH